MPPAGGPGFAPPGAGPAWSPVRAAARNLPGIGAAIAAVGLILFLVATHSMDWIEADGGFALDLGEFHDAADAAESSPFSDDDFFLIGAKVYGSWLWLATFGYLAAVATLATVFNPPNKGARAALWSLLLLPAFGILGLLGLINLADEQGNVAPRIMGALGALGASFSLVFVWISTIVEDRNGINFKTADLGMGFWMSWASLLIVAVGCAIGTRTVQNAPAAPSGPIPAGPPRP